MQKTPHNQRGFERVRSGNSYAARVAVSAGAASGTGPQIYAENMGVGSVLSPLEMMMPRGSDDSVSLRSFFIDCLTLSFCALVHTGARRP